ncbi:MAG: protease inhibitor I9 family protein [Gemmatimonadota bacterium]
MSGPRRWASVLAGASLLASCGDNPVTPEPEDVPAPKAGRVTVPSRRPATTGPDQYIIMFRDDVKNPRDVARSLASSHGLRLRHVYRHAIRGFSAVIPEAAMSALQKHPLIQTIEPNWVVHLEGTAARSDATEVVPTEGLRVHLVADDLEPLVGDGGRVASWPNRGSEGGAVQEKGNRRPTFHAGAVDFGGHGHVGFNEGADDDEVLEITGVASHGSGTLIAVFSQEDVGSHNYGIFAPYGSSTSRAGFVTQRDLGSGGPIAYWDPTNGWKSSGFRVQAGEVHVAVWRIEGSVAIDFQVDGVDQATAVVGSDMRGPFDRYLVGMTEPSTVSRFDGQIAELLFYDRKVTDAERDQIVGSLIETYGVGAPPPPPPPPHLPPRRRAVW